MNISIFKSQKKLIQEIHNEFDSAQDRLIEQANAIMKQLNIESETDIEHTANRLKSVGFHNTPIVKKAFQIVIRRQKENELLVKTKEEALTIDYYKQHYPMLKFLTWDEWDRICAKYSLAYAPIERYIKDVPVKNLTDIEQAQSLKPGDESIPIVQVYYDLFEVKKNGTQVKSKFGEAFENPIVLTEKTNVNEFRNNQFNVSNYLNAKYARHLNLLRLKDTSLVVRNVKIETIHRDGLFIAAPKSHFNLKGLKTNDRGGWFNVTKIILKDDPIVGRPVYGGIQILTKWGIEAQDPALFVDRMN